jgi:metallo-beta-lactamase family protein
MNEVRPILKFFGGVGTATGANISLQCGETKILVDCGLLQGLPRAEESNYETFAFSPAEYDFLCVTHAHMDHIGKIPKLVREGFKGRIISTHETMELAEPMLYDALKVMRARHPDKLLYEEKDIEAALSLWDGYAYDQDVILDGITLCMTDAGHILGSAIVNITYPTNAKEGKTKISFTGDLGNSPSPLLPDTEWVTDSDYIVMESVYGDRNHEDKQERDEKFKRIIKEGIARGGDIVIPAFSIERTQVMLFELNNMVEKGEIPNIPVFLDSPLADKVTTIYKKYADRFKESVREQMRKDDIFDFPGLTITKNVQESHAIEGVNGPKIIIAGSGMSEGGRVLNHESRILNHEQNTLLLVGYQPIGTLGRLLEEGNKKVKIAGKQIKVKAKVEKIEGYSSHKDSDHLIEFVEKADSTPLTAGSKSKKLKRVFVIMGETKSSLFLIQRLRDYLGVDAVYPDSNKEYLLQ